MDLNNNPVDLSSESIKNVENVTFHGVPQKQVLPSKTEVKIECKQCKKSFFPELLKKHMLISHKISLKKTNKKKFKLLGDGRVKCRDCKKKLCNLNYAKKHYKNVHLLNKVIGEMT